MAELVYAHDLKSCLARDVGSTPTPGTAWKRANLFALEWEVERLLSMSGTNIKAPDYVVVDPHSGHKLML